MYVFNDDISVFEPLNIPVPSNVLITEPLTTSVPSRVLNTEPLTTPVPSNVLSTEPLTILLPSVSWADEESNPLGILLIPLNVICSEPLTVPAGTEPPPLEVIVMFPLPEVIVILFPAISEPLNIPLGRLVRFE